MLKIIEEKSPELNETPKLRIPFVKPNRLPVADLQKEEDLSFEDVSQASSEIDEKEKRILKFLEDEDISIANPKEKEWEYAEKVKEKTFQLHSGSKRDIFEKRFTLDNADLYQKRRSSCLELGKAFLSPITTKSRYLDGEDGNNHEALQFSTSMSVQKPSQYGRRNTNAEEFALKPFKLMEEERACEGKKSKTSPLTKKQDIFKDMKLILPPRIELHQNMEWWRL